MERNDELKEIHFENFRCCYFDEIMRVEDFDFDDNLLDKKLNESPYENILVYDISCKPFMGAKPLHIRFDKVDGFIKVYDGITFFLLFGPWRYDSIYGRIRYVINDKKVVLHIVLVIILEESELILYLLKKHQVFML